MDDLVTRVTEALQSRLFVELEASGRHVHLTKEAALALFGHGLTEKRPLSQPGQFVCNERVSLITPKGRFDRVAVLGPERSECQVELSKTDCVSLGIQAPVRQSGKTEGTGGILIENGDRQLTLTSGVIIAQRHIHMTPEDAALRGLHDGAVVRLKALTERPVTFEEVVVRVSPKFRTYAHLDYDEANACGFQAGDLGMIV
ncbi:MAG: phosphate propanoyltransferase [Firmicutes bacterium]|nr:phosphate propanoyltransferase [Bacillota bacterium]